MSPTASTKLVDMGYAFRRGDVRVYNESLTTRIESAALEGGSQESSLKFKRREEVENVYSDGSATLLVTFMSVKSEDPEQWHPLTHLENHRLRLRVDRTGLVSSVAAVNDIGSESTRLAAHELDRCFHRLPATSVEVGSTWSNHLVSAYDDPFFGPMDQITQLNYRADQSVAHRGEACTEIAVSGEIQGTFDDHESGSINGTVNGKLLWANNQGFEHETHLTFDTQINLNHPDGLYSYRMLVEYHRELYPQGSVR